MTTLVIVGLWLMSTVAMGLTIGWLLNRPGSREDIKAATVAMRDMRDELWRAVTPMLERVAGVLGRIVRR